jgi:hypothetical protein
MPISSTQISNIISGQVGMFSASAQYAQAMSAQYGFSPSGSPYGPDPRMVQANASQQMQAGGLASAAARAPGMAMGAVGLASAFGYGVGALDPFSGVFRAGAAGMAGGGGWAGALGAGIGAAGMYAGASAIGGYAFGQVATGAQNRATLNAAMGGIFPGMQSGGLNMMAGQVESMQRQGMGSLRELTGLMQGGVSSGALDTSSISQFTSSFQKLVSNVRQVATVLNTSLTQAQQAMQSVKAMGISNDAAAGFLGTMRGVGQAGGIAPDQMMLNAAHGAAMGRNMGFGRAAGAMGAVINSGVHGLAMRQDMQGIYADSRDRFSQAGARFFGSRYGRTVLGAMMTDDGQLDQDMARRIAGGTMDWAGIRSAYKDNIHNARTRDMLNARTGELAGTFMNSYGGAGVAPAINAAVSGSGTSRPESMLQRLSGLNRADLNAMNTLAGAGGRLRSQLAREAEASFRLGQQDASLSSSIDRAISAMVKPYKDKFRAFGAEMQQGINDALTGISSQFSRQPELTQMQFRGGMNMLQDAQRRQILGIGGGIGSFDTSQFQGTLGYDTMGATGIASLAPSGLRMGAFAPGTGFDEMPGYGFGTESYNPYVTGAWATGMLRGPGGRNLVSWTGDGIRAAHGMGTRGLGAANAWLGRASGGRLGFNTSTTFGGARNNFVGAARGIGGLGWAGGGMLSLGGRALGAASIPLMIWDGVTNAGPELRRQRGQAAFTEGAVSGDPARMIQRLANYGVLSSGDGLDSGADVVRLPTGGAVGGFSGTPTGYTPLTAGFEGSGRGGGPGSQLFVSDNGMSRLQKLQSDQSYGVALDAAGGAESVDKIIRSLADSSDWEDKSPEEQFMGMLTHFNRMGQPITSGQLTSIMLNRPNMTNAKGKPIFKDMSRMSRRMRSPTAIQQRAAKTVGAFYNKTTIALALSENTSQWMTERLTPEDLAGMLSQTTLAIDETNVALAQSAIIKKSKGVDLSDDEQGMITALQAGMGKNFAANFAADTDKHGTLEHALAAKVAHGNPSIGNILHGIRKDGRVTGNQQELDDIFEMLSQGSATLGMSSTFDVGKWVQRLLGGEQGGRTSMGGVGAALMSGSAATDAHSFNETISALRAEGRETKARNQYFLKHAARQAGMPDLMWGRQNLVTFNKIWNEATNKDERLKARENMLTDLQGRLARGEIDDEDLATLAETMAKAGTGFGDMVSGSIGRLHAVRKKTRKKDGTVRNVDKVLMGTLGINVRNTRKYARSDLAFLKGDHDVMSYSLSGDLEDAARQLVEAELGTNKISEEAIAGKMSEMIGLIREGKTDEYEQMISTLSPVGAPGGKTAVGSAVNDIQKYAPAVAEAFKLVAAAGQRLKKESG